ncbi:MAG: hypothetical protein KC535_04300 [Nanoarchaeota archaeon]|nr:hypothetical protein [Nanoarchaeota archaeon]
MDLRIENKGLEELIITIKEAGYKPKEDVLADERIWRSYSKANENITDAAYLSDQQELIVTQTFGSLNSSETNDEAVKRVLETYQAYQNKIENISSNNVEWYTTAIGSIGGFILARHPLGLFIGGTLGYAGGRFINNTQLSAEKNKFNNYLSKHNTLLGKTALDHIKGGNQK